MATPVAAIPTAGIRSSGIQSQTAVVNPWLIAITVTLATFMELLDTAIANVSLPHIAGGLGRGGKVKFNGWYQRRLRRAEPGVTEGTEKKPRLRR